MPAKRRIVKVHNLDFHELHEKLGDQQDVKVYVSFKKGKKRKLKRMHIHFLGWKTYCECCGCEPVLEYTMGGHHFCSR